MASSMPYQQQILEHFRAALPETTDLTEGQVRILLNHFGIELSEERLHKLMAAASDESGKVTCERFISWMFGCWDRDEKAEAEKVETGQVQQPTEPTPEAKAIEDNSPAASSSRTGLVNRFRSHVSQGELSMAQLLELEEASPSSLGRSDGSEDRLQKSVEKVQEPEELQEAIKLEHEDRLRKYMEKVEKLEELQEVIKELEEEVRVDLEDPAALATFLVTANIKLIRAEYLVHLVTQDRRLPRRQEAEGEHFVDCAGKTRSALVDHEEVQAWAAGSKEAIIVSVSHAWEAREHPDPCGYQLEWVVQHALLFVAAFAAEIWLFFDYVSLFQFKREKQAEEQSFRRSMGNMHAMYAHESTITFRLESLTPEHRWQKAIKDGSQVSIFHFHDTGGRVEPVPLQALTSNTNAYLERGWCRAEVSWSSVRGDTAQHQRIDVGTGEIHTHLTGRTPVAPDVFAADMHSAAFTHRSDADAIIELQKKVFLEKVTKRRKLKLEGVSRDQMQVLAQSLPHFKHLKSITLIDFRCSKREAKAFVKALAATPIEKISLGGCIWYDYEDFSDSFDSLIKAVFAALASKTLKATRLDLSQMSTDLFQFNRVKANIAASLKSITTITDLDLSVCDLGGYVEVLAEALTENRTLKRLNFSHNNIGVRGVQALEKALESNTTLEHLELDEWSEIFSEEAEEPGMQSAQQDLQKEAIEAACHANPRICKPTAAQSEASDGSDEESLKSPFEAAVRIKGLASYLRLNKILTSVDLRGENICDETVKALAHAFRFNKTITRVNLAGNIFGDEGLKALASAMEVNETITEVWLSTKDEGRQAFQDIQRFCKRNKVQEVCQSCRSQSITEVDLRRRNLGDQEVKALADAFCVNESVTKVDLSENNFGDEGPKALASAVEVNETITEVKLDMEEGQLDMLSEEGRQAMEGIQRFCMRNKVQPVCQSCRSQSIKEVDLCERNLGDEEVKAPTAFSMSFRVEGGCETERRW